MIALDTVLHRGQPFEAGQVLPDDVDGDRLVRLGKACAGDGSCTDCSCGTPPAAKPKRRTTKPPPSGG